MRTILLIAAGAMWASGFWAQQLPQISMYQRNPLHYNAAHAGVERATRLTAISRTQWTGWEGAPSTQFVSATAPFSRGRAGGGISLMNDATGGRFYRTARLHGAYHLALNRSGLNVSAGLSVGLETVGVSFMDLYVPDGNDPLMAQPFRQGQLAAGAGLLVTGERWFASLAVPQLLQPAFRDLAPLGTSVRHGFLALGYAHSLSRSTSLQMSALVKRVQDAPTSVDVQVTWWLFDLFSLGVMGRYGEGMGVQASYTFKDGFRMAYAVDFPTNGLMSRSFGSHEIALVRDVGRLNRAITSPRFF